VFFESLFGDFESKIQSALFIQNLDKEAVLLKQVTKAVGHLRSDLHTITLSLRYKDSPNFDDIQIFYELKVAEIFKT
jgi:hypothetical protein